jgi:hypothetical protein
MDLLEDFNKKYKKLINPYIDFGDNFDNIKKKIKEKLKIDLNLLNYDLINRETNKGFKMRFHRDNYFIRKIDGKKKFIAYDKCELPKYSLIYYKNDEFDGGELEFIDGYKIKPKKDMFIFFDSNHIHRVNIQKSGIRIINLYKFY